MAEVGKFIDQDAINRGLILDRLMLNDKKFKEYNQPGAGHPKAALTEGEVYYSTDHPFRMVLNGMRLYDSVDELEKGIRTAEDRGVYSAGICHYQEGKFMPWRRDGATYLEDADRMNFIIDLISGLSSEAVQELVNQHITRKEQANV